MKTFQLFILFSICTLSINAQEVAVKNQSFEASDPERAGQAMHWDQFTETGEPALTQVTHESAQNGDQSLKLSFEGSLNSFLGVVQGVLIKPGEKLKFSVYIRNSTLHEESSVKLGMEWRDSTGKEIARVQSDDILESKLSNDNWTQFSITGLAPEGVESAGLTITLFPVSQTSGSVLIDTVTLEKVR